MTPECAAIHERGFVVLEAEYSEQELKEIRAIFHDAWRRAGSPERGGTFGFVMHPLLAYAPAMAPFYSRPRILALLSEIFCEPPRLAHNGGLWSNGDRPFTYWHHHRSNHNDVGDCDLACHAQLERISRVLANVYIDGSTPERGELLVTPRCFTDPLSAAGANPDQERATQVAVNCPPGSVVVFDQHLLHAARASQTDAPRRIFGGHYQGWSERLPHREDNEADLPGIATALAADPVLRALVKPPTVATPALRHQASVR